MLNKRNALALPLNLIIVGMVLVVFGLMIAALAGNIPDPTQMETPTKIVLDRACKDWRSTNCHRDPYHKLSKDWDGDGEAEHLDDLCGSYFSSSSAPKVDRCATYCCERTSHSLKSTVPSYQLGVFGSAWSALVNFFTGGPNNGQKGAEEDKVKSKDELKGLEVALLLPYDARPIEKKANNYLKTLLEERSADIKTGRYGNGSDTRDGKKMGTSPYRRKSDNRFVVAITDSGHLSDYCQVARGRDFSLDLKGDDSDSSKIFYYHNNQLTGKLAGELADRLGLTSVPVQGWVCPVTVVFSQTHALHVSLDLREVNYKNKVKGIFHVLRNYYPNSFVYEQVENEKRYDYDLKVTRLGLTSKSDLEAYLNRHAPNLRKYADSLYRYAQEYNIDPSFGAAVMMHESKHGTSEIFRDCNNGFGQKNNDDIDYPDCQGHGKFVAYDSVEDGIRTFYRRIRELYVNDNQQYYPSDIACVMYSGDPGISGSFREPCYVGKGGGRGPWNYKVPLHMLGMRKWSTDLDCSSDPLIMIDPGHGGSNHLAQGGPGAVVAGVMEKDLNLEMARKLRQELTNRGYQNLYMTRTNDRRVGLYARARKANAIYNVNDCDLSETVFISIHNNAAGEEVSGTETFYYIEDDPERERESRLLAGKVQSGLIGELGSENRKVKVKELAVVRDTKMPAVLAEIGFMTNSDERKDLVDDNYQQKAMRAIAEAVDDYFREQEN